MEVNSLNDVAHVCRSRAHQLQTEALATGNKLVWGNALNQAAGELGYRDWNAASAAAKVAGSSTGQSQVIPSWRHLDRALPSLPLRIHPAGSEFYRSIRELMRWAHALEGITKIEQESSRAEMLSVQGGDLPYVFVCDYGRWGDDVFRLCDRGYEEWAGITFTRDDLNAAGVIEWNERYGGHDGEFMFTVFPDEHHFAHRIQEQKELARMLAGIALVSDEIYVRQAGEVLPEGEGFTIDLTDLSQLTSARVAGLIASRDDSRHRQLRVTEKGIAYISDEVGTSNLAGLAFRLETWAQGSGYVGARAAKDASWVNQVLRDLQGNWPDPKNSLVNF